MDLGVKSSSHYLQTGQEKYNLQDVRERSTSSPSAQEGGREGGREGERERGKAKRARERCACAARRMRNRRVARAQARIRALKLALSLSLSAPPPLALSHPFTGRSTVRSLALLPSLRPSLRSFTCWLRTLSKSSCVRMCVCVCVFMCHLRVAHFLKELLPYEKRMNDDHDMRRGGREED